MLCVDLIFLCVGLCFSVFYGFWCMEIWDPEMKGKLTKMQLFHQRWFNFFCSVVGWIILFLLYKSVALLPLTETLSKLSWQHVILIIIASQIPRVPLGTKKLHTAPSGARDKARYHSCTGNLYTSFFNYV